MSAIKDALLQEIINQATKENVMLNSAGVLAENIEQQIAAIITRTVKANGDAAKYYGLPNIIMETGCDKCGQEFEEPRILGVDICWSFSNYIKKRLPGITTKGINIGRAWEIISKTKGNDNEVIGKARRIVAKLPKEAQDKMHELYPKTF